MTINFKNIGHFFCEMPSKDSAHNVQKKMQDSRSNTTDFLEQATQFIDREITHAIETLDETTAYLFNLFGLCSTTQKSYSQTPSSSNCSEATTRPSSPKNQHPRLNKTDEVISKIKEDLTEIKSQLKKYPHPEILNQQIHTLHSEMLGLGHVINAEKIQTIKTQKENVNMLIKKQHALLHKQAKLFFEQKRSDF